MMASYVVDNNVKQQGPVKKDIRTVLLKKIVIMKCTKKGFQTYQSIRAGNIFFTYTDLNGKCHSNLALTEIIELVWYWVYMIPVHNAVLWTGRK